MLHHGKREENQRTPLKCPILLILIPVMLFAFAVACAPGIKSSSIESDLAAPGDQASVSVADLEGTKWILRDYGPADDPVIALAEPAVTIMFRNQEKMHGMAGCNTYATQFTIDGSSFIQSEMKQTPFGCSDAMVWAQEVTYLTALSTAESISLSRDMLAITYNGGRLSFAPEPPPPAKSLAGTSWKLLFFKTDGATQPVIPGTIITAEFTAERIIGMAGCNSYNSAYETNHHSFTMWESLMTAETCQENGVLAQKAAQEAKYMAALHSAYSFTLDDHILTISYDDGTLRFARLPSVTDSDAPTERLQ